MKFTVRRERWARGGKNGPSALRNLQGNQCCIGSVCRQLGASAKNLLGVHTAGQLTMPPQKIKNVLLKRDGLVMIDRKWVDNAYCVNDDTTISDKERESRLKRIFRRAGHTITFID